MDLGNLRHGDGALGDEELVRAFQAGDLRAFDELTIRHRDRIVNLCRRLLGDYEDACDAAQDVFVKVLGSLGGFRFQASFSTWLYRIAVNTCKNRIGSLEYRFGRLKLRIAGGREEEPSLPDIPDQRPTPDANMEEEERKMLLQRALDNLPPKYRTVVVLRDLEGMSYEEVADAAGLNVGTVKSRLARGRQALFDSLRKMYGDEVFRN